MATIWGWITTVWRWLTALPGALVAREHVQFLELRLREVKEELAHTKDLNRDLEEQVRAQHQELATAGVAKQFTHERGAEFMRRPGGGYHDAVYCPNCRTSTWASGGLHFLKCGRCHWVSSFTRREIPEIIAELERRDAERDGGHLAPPTG